VCTTPFKKNGSKAKAGVNDKKPLSASGRHFADSTSSLGGRLVLATLGFCVVFTLAAVGLRTWFAWQESIHKMSKELNLIDRVYQRALSKSIWDMDRETIQYHIESLSRAPSVGQVTVSIHGQGDNRAPEIFQRTQEGWHVSSRAPQVKQTLTYEPFAGTSENLGELILMGDERVLWAQLRSEIVNIAATQIIQSVLLASLIMLMFSRLVTVHVQRIAHHLNELTPSTLKKFLSLDRSPHRQDELTLLVAGVNHLQSNLSDYLQRQQRDEQELASHRDRLADLVRARTAELETANLRLDSLARTDSLTELSNRRHFDEIKEIELRRALRSQLPLSLLICDIDYFKRYNDTYGHSGGDDCLKTIARTLHSTFGRAGDVVARIGGEEFAVLLPATDAQHAQQLAEKLRQSLAEIAIEHKASEVSPFVTLSIGIAQLDHATVDDFATFFRQADQALYKAKETGRNRVFVKKETAP
jgi:diguanylate cyclase (GGDEF)-like protein